MTEKQIKEYERLSKLKEQYKMFIAKDGAVSITYYSHLLHDNLNAIVDDEERKEIDWSYKVTPPNCANVVLIIKHK